MAARCYDEEVSVRCAEACQPNNNKNILVHKIAERFYYRKMCVYMVKILRARNVIGGQD